MVYKNLIKSVKEAWRKFWDNDAIVGLTGIILLALASQGPINKPENKFIEYKRHEPPIVQQVQQENKYLEEFMNYFDSLPKEKKDSITGVYKSK